jgi:hypothetical protein
MKKLGLNALIGVFCLCLFSPSLPAEELKAGEAAIFMQGGKMNVGEITDISRTRLVLQLKDGREFSLERVWMINFINTDWNFPGERERMEKEEDYIFFKNDDITSGRIIDFSSTRRVFQLDTKEEIPIGRVRRIYFSRYLPPAYEARLKEEEAAKKPNFVGTYKGEIRLSSGEVRTVVLTLNEDKTAQVRFQYQQPGAASSQQGSWSENPDGTITVRIAFSGRVRRPDQGTTVFKWENNGLVSIQHDPGLWGPNALRLNRI